MPSAARVLRRLHGLSVAELGERAGQAFAIWRERRGWQTAVDEVAAPAGAADAAGWPLGAPFFASFEDLPRTIAIMCARMPEGAAAMLARANAARAGTFDLLGHRGVSFGVPVDWWREPLAGITVPDAHWSRIDYLDPAVAGDHKLIWELNRHQFLIALGMAEHLRPGSGDAEAAGAMLDAWMDANPPGRGVNWASSLEIAFRSLAWLWTLALLRDRLTLATRARMLGYLRHSGRHLERFLSTYFSPNTHLTGEALGLFALGTALSALPEAARWRARGEGILLEWLPRHVRADGGYVEQSTWYHRYTFDIYLHAALLAERGGHAVPLAERGGHAVPLAERGGHAAPLAERDGHTVPLAARGRPSARAGNAMRDQVLPVLERMAEFMAAIMRPDGSMPLIGDDDGGKLMMLDERSAHDVRTPLAIVAALSGRGDLARLAGKPSSEMLWLLGPDALEGLDGLAQRTPSFTSRAFRDSGFVVLRDNWGAQASVCTVNCGPHGFRNAGHAHADALALDLTLGGRPIFVDPGTFTYTVLPAERDNFRHTRMHSAVTVDGASSSRMAGPFQWETMARSELVQWEEREGLVSCRGRHDGFEHLPLGQGGGATYERTVALIDDRLWMVRDVIAGTTAAAREIAVHFQCAPGLEARVDAPDRIALVDGETIAATLVTVAPDGGYRVDGGWVSPTYGVRTAAPHLRFALRRAGRVVVTTFIATGNRLTVEATQEPDREDFRVSSADARWLVQVTGSGAVSHRASDGAPAVVGGG